LSAILTTWLFERKTGVRAYFQRKLFQLPKLKWLLIGLGMPIGFFLIPFSLPYTFATVFKKKHNRLICLVTKPSN
jgi:hypothetical protein